MEKDWCTTIAIARLSADHASTAASGRSLCGEFAEHAAQREETNACTDALIVFVINRYVGMTQSLHTTCDANNVVALQAVVDTPAFRDLSLWLSCSEEC